LVGFRQITQYGSLPPWSNPTRPSAFPALYGAFGCFDILSFEREIGFDHREDLAGLLGVFDQAGISVAIQIESVSDHTQAVPDII
jgi:hypothetical protein